MAARKNCEITKAVSDLSSSSSDDSDFDDMFSSSQSMGQTSALETAKTTEKQPKPMRRLPTRRPDPNVCNRNALLARENRRKKKEYVETLEKELDVMKVTNKQLHKLLRKQMKMVKKLEHEKQYYKGLISNHSDILNLVSVLNSKAPLGSSSSVFSTHTSSCSPTDSNRSTSSLEPLAINYDCTDNADSNYEPYTETNWDQLLGMVNDPLPEEPSGFSPNNSQCEVQSNISGEHNYFNVIKEEKDSGLCLHVAHGKISLEDCPSCHLNAKRSSTLPDQLLVID